HRQIVPSLHSSDLNSNIDFSKTPFIVNQSLSTWNNPQIDGEFKPRIAGVSSFGAGGVNAHVIVQEYVQPSLDIVEETISIDQLIIPLSARTERQLKQKAQDLLDYIHMVQDQRELTPQDLQKIAYTLQVGREAMIERIGLIVNSIDQLIQKLQQYINGEKYIEDTLQGQVQHSKETIFLLNADSDLQLEISQWIIQRKLDKLLDLWIKGLEINWDRFYGKITPQRISLPTYPLAAERYWIDSLDPVDSTLSVIKPLSGLSNSLIQDNENSITLQQSSVKSDIELWDNKSYLCRWEEEKVVYQNNSTTHNKVLIVYNETSFHFEKVILDYYQQNEESQVTLIQLTNETKQISERKWLCNINDHTGFASCLNHEDKFDALYFIAMSDQKQSLTLQEKAAISQEYNEIQLLRLIKYLKQNNKIKGKIDSYILTCDNYSIDHVSNNYMGAGITGLGYSLAQGNYQFQVRNIDLSSKDLDLEENQSKIFTTILNESPSDRGEVYKIDGGKRYRQSFVKIIWNSIMPSAIRQDGVYIIVGGSGTVGQIFTRYFIQKYNASVIWIGRSARDSEDVQTKLHLFESLNKLPFYVQADVTDLNSIQKAIELIKEKYKKIHGAIFAGMVFDFDNSIEQTDETKFRSILEVKTLGSSNYYTALENESLDFMCYFSSGQAYSFSGASKLSAYASGITFADSFIHFLQEKSKFPVGIINWGFWKSSVQEMTKDISTSSLDALDDEEGFKCFERFAYELQKGRLRQILCMKVSPQVETLMNCDRKNVAVLINQSQTYPNILLKNSIELPSEEISKLKNTHERNDLETNLVRLLYCNIKSMVGEFLSQKPYKLSELQQHCNIIEKYALWWSECIDILVLEGYIQLENDLVFGWKPVNVDEIRREWQIQRRRFMQNPDLRPWTILADDCLAQLPDILRGQIMSTDIIFPHSSMDKVEGVYKNNLLSDTFNEIIANAVVAYIQKRLASNPNDHLKILEIGAGTGGTSAIVFSKIQSFKDSIQEYCYTDLSKAFLFHAEEKYGAENPYLHYKLLDIEKPIEDQGIEIGQYDLVIATNVLHATKNIRQVLRNTKSILHPKGLLLINELSNRSVFNHLTFGLLDGWWLFEDRELRIPNSPILYPDSWKQVLREEGFLSIFFPVEDCHNLGQQIIIAESDGIILQKNSEESIDNKSNELVINTGKNTQYQKTELTLSGSPDIIKYIQDNLLNCLSDILKISLHDIHKNTAFSDYGLDSILGVSFVDRINKQLSISLNTAVIFEYSSVDALTKHIVSTYNEQINSQINLDSIGLSANRMDDTSLGKEYIASTSLQKSTTALFDNDSKSNIENSKIAVIGMSGKFPKAENIDEFWQNLIDGVDGIEELPNHYLDQEKYFSEKKEKGKTRCKWGGVLAERDCFDPLFFQISPKEAEAMNPHQRLVLQESWKAIEDAGYNPKQLSGSQTGVFIGAEPTGYLGDSFTGYSDAIIASRLSYFINLNGPAFVVNTGCSSSAVAIHIACESLRNGETDQAIAGGVYAYINQKFLVSLDEIGMLSPRGRCSTFDSAADGTVLSEGIGIVVLKRLKDAIAAGDHIYGVICGSGINQDGASNGITAPNGVAQEKLITDVYTKYQINPENISYVEAHGTGTNLGDPVEANALKRAFSKFTTKQNFCSIGSAKSHIGHTSSAAGVIGLIKILLSIKHKRIPVLLNLKVLNPLIEFENSPFYINNSLVDWKSKDDSPLMAAINSFGHSGTNAHMVVSEYPFQEDPAVPVMSSDVLIPLSAHTSEQLRQKAIDLHEFITRRSSSSIDLLRMSYTLQVGRESMDERLGFLVSSVFELQEKLVKFIDGEDRLIGMYRGQVKNNKDGLRFFNHDLETKEMILDKWLSEHRFDKILDLWVNGLDLDWSRLYGTVPPLRMHLPVYPFSQDRYWVSSEVSPVESVSGVLSTSPLLHPLLHVNTSNLICQSYRSHFTGEEFFFRDHQVRGHKTLPGVAYLEILRAAIFNAVPPSHRKDILELREVVWIRPFLADTPRSLEVILYPGTSHEELNWEIIGIDNNEDYIYCRGQAIFRSFSDISLSILPLSVLNERMIEGCIDKNILYSLFSSIGLDFGPSHQGLIQVHKGKGELLSVLRLPSIVSDSFSDYYLHPGIMDSALQSSICLLNDLNNFSERLLLPFALKSVFILSRCTTDMFAWVRYSEVDSFLTEVVKLDIDLCDQEGNICVQMKEVTFRLSDNRFISGDLGFISSDFHPSGMVVDKGLLLSSPVWKPLEVDFTNQTFIRDYAFRLVLLYDVIGLSSSDVSGSLQNGQCLSYSSSISSSLGVNYIEGSVFCFETIRSLFEKRFSGDILFQVVIGQDVSSSVYGGLSGLLKTAHMENPGFRGQLIHLNSPLSADSLSDVLNICGSYPSLSTLLYQDHMYYYQDLEELSLLTLSSQSILKDSGVYLITGGMGGLGFLFTRDILNRTSNSRILLSGRKRLDKNISDHLDRLNLRYPCQRVFYYQSDLSEQSSVESLISQILSDNGSLDG
ncbi:MAG: SDR family NAD(P)-dependent oxidoreductase, partial [Prevotella sp.]|nr:SDR family NAD(P)-dependent oxidoreductase [Prevotella sp.]